MNGEEDRSAAPAEGSIEKWAADNGALSPAELKLIAALNAGVPARVWDRGTEGEREDAGFHPRAPLRPIRASEANCVRAKLLIDLLQRAIAIPLPANGVQLSCAWIEGRFDLHGLSIDSRIRITSSTFEAKADLSTARLPGLDLTGSWLKKGLEAGEAVVAGSVYLRNGFRSDAQIRLPNTKIGGDLNCAGAELRTEGALALHAGGAQIDGGVNFGGGFRTEGAVTLRDARIGRDVYCVGGGFSQSPQESKPLLNLNGAKVTGRILMRQPRSEEDPEAESDHRTWIDGLVDLRGASCAMFSDDALEQAPAGFRLRLNGFRYDQIEGPTDYKRRAAWLRRQHEEDLKLDFKPQPFEQLARVLKETGHEYDARRISVIKLQERRPADLAEAWRDAGAYWRQGSGFFSKAWSGLKNLPAQILDLAFAYAAFWASIVFEMTLGFGYRPARALFWAGIFTLLGALVFWSAYRDGVMVPNSVYVLRSEAWTDCLKPKERVDDGGHKPGETTAACWLQKKQGGDYQRFAALAYSVDVFLPIFDLHQETTWIPQPERAEGPNLLAHGARIYQWVHTALGYLLSALAVAGFTGIVKKD